MWRRSLGLFGLGCVLALGIGACSDDEEGKGLGNAVSGGGPSIPPPTLTGGQGGSSGSGQGGQTSKGGKSGNGMCVGLPFEEQAGGEAGSSACVGISTEAEVTPVDLYIIMDRSVSMGYEAADTGMTRWEAIRAAVEEFVSASEAGSIGAGIGFFGLSGGSDDDLDCDASNYESPVVPIGPLSEVGEDIVAAIDDVVPGGLTPVLPALEGAIAYAKEWAEEHPERATMVVLVSDAFPTQCSNAVSDVVDVAREAFESEPSVRTYAVGIEGAPNLDAIARGGGTREGHLVDESNLTDSFLQTLLNISNAQLACQYRIPMSPDPDLRVDFDEVQVVYTPASGEPEEIPRLESSGACDRNPNGGWFYDNPADPRSIQVCPCTCERFGAGRVEIRLGCEPRLGLR
ncbi:MAG: VWA domain-containing protein [Pseudomonadota bacterium]